MSFYHVLANNVSPDVFPNNHASKFSTPLEQPYNMKRRYEVALMNVTYGGCVNTFDNDVLTVSTPFPSKSLEDTTIPIRFNLNKEWTVNDFVQDINVKMKDIMSWSVHIVGASKVAAIRWKVINSNFCLVMSKQLSRVLKSDHRVITHWDMFGVGNQVTLTDLLGEDAFYFLLPLDSKSDKIRIKAVNEILTEAELIDRFNTCTDMARIAQDRSLQSQMDEDEVLLLSPKLNHSLMYPKGGMTAGDVQTVLPFNYISGIKEEFYVTTYKLDNIQVWCDYNNNFIQRITLPPHSFRKTKDVLPYLADHVNVDNAFFRLKHDFLTLHIKNKDTSVRFSDTLRDIFAFDKNEYSGVGVYRASDILSLTRRIQYLYIYSNISSYVRVGNTEAPLLAIIPFEGDNSCTTYVDKNFVTPMYVKVSQDSISQIDISIYDGAGALVPFTDKSLTTVRLHYRPL